MQEMKKLFHETPVQKYLSTMNELAFEGKMLVPVVAIDDGYAQLNSAVLVLTKKGEDLVPEIKEFVMPSIGRRGRHISHGIGGSACLYGTYDTGEEFTIHEYVPDPEDTRKEDYPVSTLNLCLAHAALENLGLVGENCALVTGLPLEQFMDGDDGFNSALISKKCDNLRRPVYSKSKDNRSADVVYAGVYPEAIAGIVDYLIDEFGNDKEGINREVARLAIDIGGNTTDLAIVLPNHLVAAKQTISQGVKHVKDRLRTLLKKRFDFEPDNKMLEDALRSGKVQYFGGDEENVQQEVDDAVSSILEPLASQIDTFKKNFPSLQEIVGFGGGVALMEENIRSKMPNIVVVENPAGANARGFLKCALIFDFDQIMASVEKVLEENKQEQLQEA